MTRRAEPEHRSDVMRPGEVAARFGVCDNTVRNWRARGLLPHVRTLGGHCRYLRTAVEALHEITDLETYL